MVRLMKTAATLGRKSRNPQVIQLASLLMDQLVDIMPELKDIGPWQDDSNGAASCQIPADEEIQAEEEPEPGDW